MKSLQRLYSKYSTVMRGDDLVSILGSGIVLAIIFAMLAVLSTIFGYVVGSQAFAAVAIMFAVIVLFIGIECLLRLLYNSIRNIVEDWKRIDW